MEALKQRIRDEGKNLGGGILKVDGFINHQVDAALMGACGEALAGLLGATTPDKVLTAEISGIAPAVMTGMHLGIPVVYARKTRPITMPEDTLRAQAPSHTKGRIVELMVSPEYLCAGDRVLIIDDFLASGRTILALAELAAQAGATVVGVGALVEKPFEGGRDVLAHLSVPVESLAVIESLEGGQIVVR